MTSTEYFECEYDQSCCGDAWDRYCCDKSKNAALIIGLVLFAIIGILFGICLCIAVYHFKKKTKYYYNFVNWYAKPLSKKHKVRFLE